MRPCLNCLFFTLCVIAALGFSGCGENDSNNPLTSDITDIGQGTPLQNTGKASLSFQIKIPEGWQPSESADIKMQTSDISSPAVSFELTLFNMNQLTEITLKKTAEVVGNTAQANFQGLPAWPAILDIVISKGSYQGASNLIGSMDLSDGDNVMIVSPAGSNATTTIVAHVMKEFAKIPDNLKYAPTQFATGVYDSISALNLNSENIYTEALDAFESRIDSLTTVANNTFPEAFLTDILTGIAKDAALIQTSDFSSLTEVPLLNLKNISANVAIPALPSIPPVIPSDRPTMQTSTTSGNPPNTAVTDWYAYVPFLNPAASWAEWKTVVVSNAVPVMTSYWRLSPPIAITQEYQTREFIGSNWSNNSLYVYTVGTGTYYANGALTASGTQVANVKVQGADTQLAWKFSINLNSDGSAAGTIEYQDGGSINLNRSAPNSSAIGTTSVYCQLTGTINAVTPVNHTLTFQSTIYGNSSKTVVISTASINTTLNYSADGSGSGSVSGAAERAITLTWDNTGNATATITLNSLSKTISTTVLSQPVIEVPAQ